MKVNIREMPDDRLSLDLTVDEETVIKASTGSSAGLSDGSCAGAGFGTDGPLKAHLDLQLAGEMLVVEGGLHLGLRLVCSRCLKGYALEVAPTFTLYYVVEAGEGGEDNEGAETELTTSDVDVGVLGGDELDTTEILLEQLALDIPIKPLCSDDCKGLCPKCGAGLNEGTCVCKIEKRVDMRLSALKDFKPKKLK